MSYPVYYVPSGDVLPVMFSSYAGSTGASATLTGLAVTDIEIYKDGSTTQRASDAGYTLLDTDGIDFDAITGIHGFSIDTGDNTDAGFYTVGAWFHVVVSAVTIDSQTVNFIACAFRLMPAESVAGKPKVDVDAWLGTAAATPTTAGVPEVDITHIAGSAVNTSSAQLGVNVVNAAGTAWGSGAITAGVIAADAIGASELAADAVAEIADAVWDEATSGHVTSGTFGQGAYVVRANTAQAGAATTITLDASASAVDDFYNNTLLFITGGTGAGQARYITDYVGATKVATVGTWVTNPSSDSVFVILPRGSLPGASAPTAAEIADAVWDEDATAHQTGGTFGQAIGDPGADTNTIFKAVVTDATGATVGADAAAILADTGTDGVVVASINANAITATSIATDAITAAKVADGTIDANTFAAGAINAAAIADNAIDRATFAADTGLQSIRSNTAQAGGATSITLDASASATNDFYKNSVIYLTGGTGVGQYRICTAYDGTTKVATTTPAWATNPDVTSTFAILPSGTVNLAAILASAVSTTSAQLGVNVVNAGGTAWASGSLTSGVFAAGAIDAAAIAANAIGASELAADAVAEIADAVWDEDIVAAHGTADTAGLFLKDVEAAVDTEIAAIKAKTDQLTFTTANQVDATTVTVSTGAIGTGDIATAALNEIADAILDRNMATGTDSGTEAVRTVRQALRALRNKVSISAGTATITKENDTTASWTAAITTTAGDPISAVDPADA